jgi:hypothetical protein
MIAVLPPDASANADDFTDFTDLPTPAVRRPSIASNIACSAGRKHHEVGGSPVRK